jgi:predicted peptidase
MMIRIVERLALALLIATALGARPRDEVLEANVFHAADGRSMPYRLFVPEDYTANKKYPVVMFLHGGGGRGSDNRKQIEGGNGYLVDLLVSPDTQAKHACIVVAPQSSPLGWVGYDSVTPTDELELVLKLLQHLERTYRIDPDRRYVLGQSMGGFGTFAILTLKPDLFAAAISICGGGAERTAAKIARVPIWTFHGDRDEVVPIERSRKMIAALTKAGGKPRQTEYKGEGHLIWSKVVREPDLLGWMFAQVRESGR